MKSFHSRTALRPPEPDPRRQQGFTLLELLLAMSLTALLLGLLSAGVYGLVRDWDDNAAGLDRSLDQTIAILQIERALQGAFPHGYRDPETLGQVVYFSGEPEQLSWVSTVSPQRDAGLMAWQLESDPQQGVLLRLAPAFTDDPQPRLQQREAIVLLPGYSASFSYLFNVGNGLDKVWREQWSGATELRLPQAVHVRLTPLAADAPPPADTELDIVAPIYAAEHRRIRPANTLFSPQLSAPAQSSAAQPFRGGN
ncbi:MAG: prepilin-type N-terminal cleavage/methylation domain-containing protein [Pseudomonadales bacterium]|nr:prepilin-type N-terminal cleavage/methylation domain-containing protein [Pseudomonadales bacterium]